MHFFYLIVFGVYVAGECMAGDQNENGDYEMSYSESKLAFLLMLLFGVLYPVIYETI